MECELPPPLTERDLENVLGSDASPEVREHLRRCRHCRERLTLFAAEEAPVRARLYRAECPSTEQLGEWQIGLLEPEEASTVAAHLALCPLCQSDIAMIAEVLEQQLTVEEPLFAGLRRLVARLAPTGQPGVGGRLVFRGERGDTRAYVVGDLQLNITVEPVHRGRYMLVGLLTRTNASLGSFAGTKVQLLEHDHLVAETTVDELDNFTFDDLPPGEYGLAVPFAQDVLLIPKLDLPID